MQPASISFAICGLRRIIIVFSLFQTNKMEKKKKKKKKCFFHIVKLYTAEIKYTRSFDNSTKKIEIFIQVDLKKRNCDFANYFCFLLSHQSADVQFVMYYY